jgi:ketosteroid isomerase-like protein
VTVEERVRGLYVAFTTGDIDRAAELFHPDAVLVDAPELPDAGAYRGRVEIGRALRTLRSVFPDPEILVERIVVAPRAALALIRVRAHGQGASVPIDTPVGHVFLLDGDELVELRAFLDHAQALDEFESQSG